MCLCLFSPVLFPVSLTAAKKTSTISSIPSTILASVNNNHDSFKKHSQKIYNLIIADLYLDPFSFFANIIPITKH